MKNLLLAAAVVFYAGYASPVIAQKAGRGHFIPVLGAALGDAGKTIANLHTLDRIDTHQGMG